MYLKYVHLSDSFNHSLPEMMYLWWLQVVWCVATLSHSWKWCFNLFSANHELNIPWIYVVYTMNVCWFLSWMQYDMSMSQGEVSFLAPKISLWRAKKDTSFWDIAICRFYKLHKKLRVKALSLSIFCHFDEVILKFWWAIEEKYCAVHMQLVCCFENVITIFLQKGMFFWLKIKNKNKTA